MKCSNVSSRLTTEQQNTYFQLLLLRVNYRRLCSYSRLTFIPRLPPSPPPSPTSHIPIPKPLHLSVWLPFLCLFYSSSTEPIFIYKSIHILWFYVKLCITSMWEFRVSSQYKTKTKPRNCAHNVYDGLRIKDSTINWQQLFEF